MKKVFFLAVVATLLLYSLSREKIFVLNDVEDFLAATFFIPSVTAAELRQKFAGYPETGKIRILVVPGHEPDFGGAEYGSLKEREMNLELAQELADLLKKDEHYDVTLTRDEDGWNPALKAYFDNNWDDIVSWTKRRKLEMRSYLSDGKVKQIVNVNHNAAPTEVATRLYGINKWSRERDFDVLIHVHFNDYPRSNVNIPGKYYGFSLYIPDRQYSSSVATRELGQSIFDSLSSEYTPSNYPGEKAGLVEDQDLIAIGANNSLDAASFLIEYGYIYRFTDATFLHKTIKEMAKLTYQGLGNFFNGDNTLATNVP